MSVDLRDVAATLAERNAGIVTHKPPFADGRHRVYVLPSDSGSDRHWRAKCWSCSWWPRRRRWRWLARLDGRFHGRLEW
jgi:hypothetical protein